MNLKLRSGAGRIWLEAARVGGPHHRRVFHPDSSGLGNALAKLDAASRGRPMRVAREASGRLLTVNPLSLQAPAGLAQSHPPIQMRARRLERMGF